ncbi:MAG: proteophosphoglycan precursor [Rhodospirillaceae bacterium]|nr:MAG: proteophosphoglycan precursor [Rhodospirillaceae bacterium]
MGKRQTDIDTVSFAKNLGTFTPSLATMPCPCGDRTFCGDLDIRISADGTWYYNATPINRPEMVQLFATMLKLDEEGRHWLVTPTEIGRIEVEDAPFTVVDVHVSGEAKEQVLCFSTNVEDVVCVAAETPIIMDTSPVTEQLTPYVMIGEGLKAKIGRSVYYELVELGQTADVEGKQMFGLWSSGSFFPLGPIDSADA